MITREEILKKYFADRVDADERFGGYPFVTISRQAGAGGRTLSRMLLERIELKRYADPFRGWRIFDEEIVDLLREDKSLSRSVRSLLDEEYHSEAEEFFKSLLGGPADQYKLVKATLELIRILASIGKVVIVGRACCCATAGMPGRIAIRLTAPHRERVDRMMGVLNTGRHKAEHVVKKQDHERERMVRDFFDKDIDDSSLYDVVIDTSEESMEDAVSRVYDLVVARSKA